MWNPNIEKINEIVSLLKYSPTQSKSVQKEISKKFDTFSKDINFPKSLIYILNSPSQPNEIRCSAGMALDGQLVINFHSFSNDNIEYFKSKILNCFFDRDNSIRKTVFYLISTFIHHFGIEMWPELLISIANNLENKLGVEMSTDILNVILTESRNVIDENYLKLQNKIIDIIIVNLTNADNDFLCNNYLNSLSVYLDCCQNISLQKCREIIPILKQYSNSSDNNIKLKIAKCWYIMTLLEKEYIYEYYEDLINFFINCFTESNYAQSLIAAKFLHYIIAEEDSFIQNENIKKYIKLKLPDLIPHLLKNLKLTDEDINYLENIFVNEENNNGSSSANSPNLSNSTINQNNNNLNSPSAGAISSGSGSNESGNSSSNSENDEDTNNSYNNYSFVNYNPNLTLRKCCGRILDKMSYLYSHCLFNVIKSLLENEMQSQNDIIKERAILAFGAIGQGCYMQIINHLKIVIPYLIRELRHPNKFVRAISLWTLSQYTRYILVDNYFENKNELFKWYLTEILTKFLDKENIVRGNAGNAFQEMLKINKILIEPYMYDVFKVIISVFDKYTGSNLLKIYEIVILLMENFEGIFQNKNLIEDLIKCLVQKWYELIKGNDTATLPMFFDVIISLINVSGKFLINYCDYFLFGCLKIIEHYMNESNKGNIKFEGKEKQIFIKSIEVLSSLSLKFPEYINTSKNKQNIVDFLFDIMNINDFSILHYAIALFGDLMYSEPSILAYKINDLIEKLLPLLNIKSEFSELEREQLSVCNYSIWTLGLIAINYPDKLIKYSEHIIEKTKIIFTAVKINKSLARNISICIGRMGLMYPKQMSKYIEGYIKPFCISLKHYKDIDEKQQAFKGICTSIMYNLEASFADLTFLCDSLCSYDKPPDELEKIFQNLICSLNTKYNSKFTEILTNFPPNLKEKMQKRFKL